MSKPEPGQDRIQREVEELLEKLDTFVPEERLASKIRNRARRQKAQGEPNALQRAWKRVARISLGQLLLAGFALILVAWFFRAPLGGFSTWLIGLGLVMAAVAFVLSMMRGGTGRTVGGSVERRWRGQPIEYSSGPSAADRIRDWFRRRRH
jgi:hypothetical protein